MKFQYYIEQINRHKAIVDPNKLFDFAIDYGFQVLDRLNIPHMIKGKVNPYVMKEADMMLGKITHSIIQGYYKFGREVDLNAVLERINLESVVSREFSCGTFSIDDHLRKRK